MIDAHHHLWNPDRVAYPWMTGALARLHRRYDMRDYDEASAGCDVRATVAVQAAPSHAETVDLLRAAAQHPRLCGVVGWVDLERSDVGRTLADLMEQAEGRLVGLRHQAHDEADAMWLARPAVKRGVAAVGEACLAFDLLVRPRELPAAVELVQSLPGTRFVLDHLGKPPLDGEMKPWETGVRTLAECANVAVKLSGLATEADWDRWREQDLLSPMRRALDWFGASRTMFGSDWPVCTLAADFADVVALARHAALDLSAADRAAVFEGTAAAWYRLRL